MRIDQSITKLYFSLIKAFLIEHKASSDPNRLGAHYII